MGRIVITTTLVTFLILIPVSAGMVLYVNVPTSKLFPEHRILDSLSVLLFMAPFYFGMHILFKERLRFGRQYVEEGRWKEAIAALEPFDSPTQRFLDRSGEAHYFLAVAYSNGGNRVKADRIKAFILKHRPGEWADKLKGVDPPRVSVIKASRTADTSVSEVSGDHDKFSRPTSRPEKPRSTAPAKRKKRF